MLKECEVNDSSKEDDVEENDKPCGPVIEICNFSELDQSPNPAVKKMLDYTKSYKNQVQKDTMLEADSEQKFRKYTSRHPDIYNKLRDEALTTSNMDQAQEGAMLKRYKDNDDDSREGMSDSAGVFPC